MPKQQILKFVRSPEVQAAYEAKKSEWQKTKRCPFCNLDKDLNRVIEKRYGWIVFENAFPYQNTKRHLIIIPTHHCESWKSLSWDKEMGFMQIIGNYLQEPEVTLLIRGDDNAYKSIEHLHAHLLVFEENHDF